MTEMIISTQDYKKRKLKLESSEWKLNILGLDPSNQETWLISEDKLKKMEYKYFSKSPGWSLIGIKV